MAAQSFAATVAPISAVYIGGGTPSLANFDLFARWLEMLQTTFVFADEVEFSVEFNPETASLETLSAFKNVGVTRPVFGVQTFHRRLLKLLRRRHEPFHSFRAVYYANALGFADFSIDLLYGVPMQTSKILSADLDQLLDLEPPHISFYQLDLKAGTELANKIVNRTLKKPDPELVSALYRGGGEQLIEAGYTRYEVSSFAKPGHECRYNLMYWEGNDYLGLGPSARSWLNEKRFANVSDIETYIETLNDRKMPHVEDTADAKKQMFEALTMGLRTSRGISRSQFSERFGVPVEAYFNKEQYRQLVESGQLVPEGESLKLSEEGILNADEIARRLIE